MPMLYSWLRWSTPEQSLKGSQRRQIEGGRQWAAENGFEFGEVFVGAGLSAYRGEHRVALEKFFERIKEGIIKPGDGLWVENFDRLSRERVTESLDLFRRIIASGVMLVVRGQRYTPEILDAQGHLWHEIVGEMNRAHEESRRKTEMVNASYDDRRQRALANGTPIMGKSCPAWLVFKKQGYTVSEGCYEPHPDRNAVVVQIFMLADSGYGCRDICKLFNDKLKPVPTFGRRNKLGWQPGYVRKVLRDKAVLGIHVGPDGREYQIFPQIINEALFERVQVALDGRKIKGRGRNGEGYPNLVKGLCVCPECHQAVGIVTGRVTTERAYKYLKCKSAQWGKCEHREMFPYWKFEPLLLSLYEVQIAVEATIPQPGQSELAKRIADTEAMIARKQTTLDTQTPKLFEDRPAATVEAISRYLDRLGRELEQHKREIVELRRLARIDEEAEERGFWQRFYEARDKLESSEPKIREYARKHVAQEFRRIIEAVTLFDKDRITVTMKARGGVRVHYGLNQQKVTDIRLVADSGSITHAVWLTLPNGTVVPCLIGDDGLIPVSTE